MRNKMLSLLSGSHVTSKTLEATKVYDLKTYAYSFSFTDLTPVAKEFSPADLTVVGTVIAEAAHGFVTGLKVQVTTADTLPTGLLALTDYYVIVLTAGTYSLAESYADALAGTPVVVTDQGVGVQTVTPVALDATIKLEKSIDRTVFFDVAAATVIAADGSVIGKEVDIGYRWVRPILVVNSGLVGIEVKISGITEF